MGAGCGAPAPRGGQRDGEPAAVGGRVGPCPPAAQQHRRGSRPRWMAAVQPPPDGCAPASSSGAPTASPPALDAAEPPAPLAGWESPPAGWGGGRAASPDGWLAGRAGCRPGWLGVGLPRGAGPPPTCPRGWLAARLAIGGWVFVCESPGEGRLLSDRVRMRARAAGPECCPARNARSSTLRARKSAVAPWRAVADAGTSHSDRGCAGHARPPSWARAKPLRSWQRSRGILEVPPPR